MSTRYHWQWLDLMQLAEKTWNTSFCDFNHAYRSCLSSLGSNHPIYRPLELVVSRLEIWCHFFMHKFTFLCWIWNSNSADKTVSSYREKDKDPKWEADLMCNSAITSTSWNRSGRKYYKCMLTYFRWIPCSDIPQEHNWYSFAAIVTLIS